MKLAVLYSGGKDSTLALKKVMEKDDVVCLISIISKNPESYMFHVPNIKLTSLQAKAMGLPIVSAETMGEKEEELADLSNAIEKAAKLYGIEGVVTGAIESVYQSSRIEKICNDLDLKCINPIWKMNQIKVLEEVVDLGFEVIISGYCAEQFDSSWLCRRIDKKAIEELKALGERFKINPSGEGGEIETTVLDAPFFKKRIEIVESEKKVEEDSGVLIVKKAELVDK